MLHIWAGLLAAVGEALQPCVEVGTAQDYRMIRKALLDFQTHDLGDPFDHCRSPDGIEVRRGPAVEHGLGLLAAPDEPAHLAVGAGHRVHQPLQLLR